MRVEGQALVVGLQVLSVRLQVRASGVHGPTVPFATQKPQVSNTQDDGIDAPRFPRFRVHQVPQPSVLPSNFRVHKVGYMK